MPRKLATTTKAHIKQFGAKYGPDVRPVRELEAEYFSRLRKHDDEATVTLVGHLLIENLMDKIIQKKCKSPRAIIDDSRSYTFAVKLQMIYSFGLLPEYLYQNIRRLNGFRNKFAHKLEFEVDSGSMLINHEHSIEAWQKTHPKEKSKRRYFFVFCYAIIEQMSAHMLKIDVDPRLLPD